MGSQVGRRRYSTRLYISATLSYVRGDSLRDLYAKALALLGLGLLGVAGALVDYWPVRGDLPTVASVLSLPEPLRLLAVPADSTPTPLVTRASTMSAPRAARTENPPVADASLDAAVPENLTEVLPATAAPSLEPEFPPSLAVTPAQPDNIPSSTLSLMPPVIVAPEAFLSVPPVPAPSGDNMFEAAAKTAGRVGLKTGSVIVNGFRAVGHAFRWPL